MDRKDDRRVRRTKTNIKKAFIELLKEKSFQEITVRELSERADINRKTFYAYYTGMEELLAAVMDEMLEKYRTGLRKISFRADDFDAASLFKTISALIREDLEHYIRFHEIGLLAQFGISVKDIVVEIFMEQNKIDTRAIPEKYYLCAEYVASGVLAAVSAWAGRAGSGSMDIDEFTSLAASLALDGIRGMIRLPDPQA